MVASDVPPVDVRYQRIPVPVAVRLATVGLGIEQKVWVALPEGAPGLLTITLTASREVDSQPLTV